MWINVTLLTIVAVLLAGPLSQTLARATWPQRNPKTALLLWQAIGLAGGLALLFIGVSLTETGLPNHSIQDFTNFPLNASAVSPIGWIGCGVTIVIASWLLGVTARSGRAFLRTLRRSRQTIQLLGESIQWPWVASDGHRPPETSVRRRSSRYVPGLNARQAEVVHILPFSIPSAYCVGGVRPKIVLTAAALTSLDRRELCAIIAHEQAHARYHHDLVIQPFVAWHRAFPFLRPAFDALRSVETLIELHADDSARKEVGLTSLVSAITSVRRLQGQHTAMDLSAPALESALRIQHLDDATISLNPLVQIWILFAAIIIVALPFFILFTH